MKAVSFLNWFERVCASAFIAYLARIFHAGAAAPRQSAAFFSAEGGRALTRRRCRAPGAALFLAAFAHGATSAAPITALAFSPDGSVLVSNGARSLEFRSPNDGSVRSRIPCDLPKIESLAFHPRGERLVVAGGSPAVSGEVRILDWRKRTMLHRLTNHTDLVTCAAFNSDGTLLGVASANHSAEVWQLNGATMSKTFSLVGHAGPVLAIAFSPNGQSIVTVSADRSVKVWSAEDGNLLRTFTHHTESVHAVAFRPQVGDAEYPVTCATGGDDRTVRIWQPEIGRMVRIVRPHQGPVFALAYSTDGQSLFSIGKEGMVRRIDAHSDAILAEWTAHSDWAYALAVSPDGTKLATGDWSGSVKLWDL